MTAEEIARLLSDGVIERVAIDREAAARELDGAEAHLVDIESRAAFDPGGALSLAYDAMRKAMVAHMRSAGYRVRARGGAHARTGRYALAALDHLGITEDLQAFDDLRRLRNRSEYDALQIDQQAAIEAIAHARAVVEAVRGEFSE